MRWKCEKHMEIGKWKQENCEEKILTHAAHEWGARRIERLRWTRDEREKSKVKARKRHKEPPTKAGADAEIAGKRYPSSDCKSRMQAHEGVLSRHS